MKKLFALLVGVVLTLGLFAAPAFACNDYEETPPPQEEITPPPVEHVQFVTYQVKTRMPVQDSVLLTVPEGTGFSVRAKATSFVVTFSSGDRIVVGLDRWRNNPTRIRVLRDGERVYFGDQNGSLL